MALTNRHHRPVLRDPAVLEEFGRSSDPVAEMHAAHETAAVLVHAGRASDDPATVDRLVELVDEIGLPTVADLWSQRPARSLPGALWRLYALREWVSRHPHEAAHEYAAGIPITEPDHAVAGVEPPGPDEIRRVADLILRGVYAGDLAFALERAAAFCQVVSAGRGDLAQGRTDLAHGTTALASSAKLREAGRDLAACARMWRAGDLS
ncbi:hypothetical protein GCM10027418_12630 [Mariniluteicoccus endophyticus]